MNPFSVAEIQKTQAMGKPMRESKYVDIYREKPIRVSVKVLVPVREHPKVIISKNYLNQIVYLL